MARKPDFIKRVLEFWRQRWMTSDRRQSTFQHIYQANRWRNDESRSGHGSSLEQTATVREALPPLIEALSIRSLVDVPCGDFYWMQKVDLRGAAYIGLDIVEALIEENGARYGQPSREFRMIDIAEGPPPKSDLILCRDLLVHFSFADINRAIANFKASGATYLLTTTFPETLENENILTGNWRRLNLQRAPFDFPEPERLINENCTEDDGAYGDKSLGLWKIADL